MNARDADVFVQLQRLATQCKDDHAGLPVDDFCRQIKATWTLVNDFDYTSVSSDLLKDAVRLRLALMKRSLLAVCLQAPVVSEDLASMAAQIAEQCPRLDETEVVFVESVPAPYYYYSKAVPYPGCRCRCRCALM